MKDQYLELCKIVLANLANLANLPVSVSVSVSVGVSNIKSVTFCYRVTVISIIKRKHLTF